MRQFEADIAAADHDEVLRQTVKVQELNVRHGSRCCSSGHIRDNRARAQIEEYAVAGDHARASVVERNFYGSRSYETRRSHDQLCAARLVKIEMALNLLFDHFSFAALDAFHVNFERSEFKPEFSRAACERCYFRAVNDVLAGQTGDIRA